MAKIFVFGSNREGRHGKGAALEALQRHGAIHGQATGLQGNSYAIVTKELRKRWPSVKLPEVREGVDRFLDFMLSHPEHAYYITRLGCGLAGFRDECIAPLFIRAFRHEDVVYFPPEWDNILTRR